MGDFKVSLKAKKCWEFFSELSHVLIEEHDYKLIRPKGGYKAAYLIPKGTEKQLSYYGKPVLSFRCSDDWNWYTSKKRCPDPEQIQCHSVDIPGPLRREDNDGTKPIKGWNVAFYGSDNKYHCVYGTYFDRTDLRWGWKETSVQEVIDQYLI